MAKTTYLLEKVNQASLQKYALLKDLMRHDYLENEEKVACEKRIVENFELEKKAVAPIVARLFGRIGTGGGSLAYKGAVGPGRGIRGGFFTRMGRKAKLQAAQARRAYRINYDAASRGIKTPPITKKMDPRSRINYNYVPKGATARGRTYPTTHTRSSGKSQGLRTFNNQSRTRHSRNPRVLSRFGNLGTGRSAGATGTGTGWWAQTAKPWIRENPGLAIGAAAGGTLLTDRIMNRGGGSSNNHIYRYGEYVKQASWTKAIATGAISAVPVSILAAIGYKNLKEDMAAKDSAVQARLKNIHGDVAAVGAAHDLAALNQLFGPYGPQPTAQPQHQMYNSPEMPMPPHPDMTSMPKQSSLDNEEMQAKLYKVGELTITKELLENQLDNDKLSKAAKDYARELLDVNRTKFVEALKDLVWTK